MKPTHSPVPNKSPETLIKFEIFFQLRRSYYSRVHNKRHAFPINFGEKSLWCYLQLIGVVAASTAIVSGASTFRFAFRSGSSE